MSENLPSEKSGGADDSHREHQRNKGPSKIPGTAVFRSPYSVASKTAGCSPYYLGSSIQAANASDEDKRRIMHNEVERKRKEKLNRWIVRLCSLVPDCNGKLSKNIVLERTANFIQQLMKERELPDDVQALKTEVIKLTEKVEALSSENAQYLSLLKEAQNLSKGAWSLNMSIQKNKTDFSSVSDDGSTTMTPTLDRVSVSSTGNLTKISSAPNLPSLVSNLSATAPNIIALPIVAAAGGQPLIQAQSIVTAQPIQVAPSILLSNLHSLEQDTQVLPKHGSMVTGLPVNPTIISNPQPIVQQTPSIPSVPTVLANANGHTFVANGHHVFTNVQMKDPNHVNKSSVGSTTHSIQTLLRDTPAYVQTVQSTGSTTNLYMAQNTPIMAQRTPLVANGTPLMANGTPIMANGTPILANGTPIMANGTPMMASGTSIMTNGTPMMANGTTLLANGTPFMANGPSIMAQSTPIVAAQPQTPVLVQGENGPVVIMTPGSLPYFALPLNTMSSHHMMCEPTASFKSPIVFNQFPYLMNFTEQSLTPKTQQNTVQIGSVIQGLQGQQSVVLGTQPVIGTLNGQTVLHAQPPTVALPTQPPTAVVQPGPPTAAVISMQSAANPAVMSMQTGPSPTLVNMQTGPSPTLVNMQTGGAPTMLNMQTVPAPGTVMSMQTASAPGTVLSMQTAPAPGTVRQLIQVPTCEGSTILIPQNTVQTQATQCFIPVEHILPLQSVSSSGATVVTVAPIPIQNSPSRSVNVTDFSIAETYHGVNTANKTDIHVDEGDFYLARTSDTSFSSDCFTPPYSTSGNVMLSSANFPDTMSPDSNEGNENKQPTHSITSLTSMDN